MKYNVGDKLYRCVFDPLSELYKLEEYKISEIIEDKICCKYMFEIDKYIFKKKDIGITVFLNATDALTNCKRELMDKIFWTENEIEKDKRKLKYIMEILKDEQNRTHNRR